MTNPMWVALFSYIALGEKLSCLDFLSIFLAFLGVALVNDPFNWNGLEVAETSKRDTLIGVICCLIAAIGGAVSFVCMRLMRADIHFSVSPFWFSLGCTLLSPIGAMAVDVPKE